MLSEVFQAAEILSFLYVASIVWRASKWPGWRIRAIVYGWALFFLWSFVWAIIFPVALRNQVEAADLADAFPDGPIALAFLFGGWIYPAIIVAISSRIGCPCRRLFVSQPAVH